MIGALVGVGVVGGKVALGVCVGAAVGVALGLTVGAALGLIIGTALGLAVGAELGIGSLSLSDDAMLLIYTLRYPQLSGTSTFFISGILI